MSKYTTEVRFICEAEAGLTESTGYNNVATVIAAAIPNIFNFDFPIFDESYRNVLCTKILKHYYTREIGFETYGLWKLKLDTEMNEIMPYYNKLYESVQFEYNPLYDADYTKTGLSNDSGNDARSSIQNEESKKTGTVGESGESNIINQKSGITEESDSTNNESKKSGSITDIGSNSSVEEKNGINQEDNSNSGEIRKTGSIEDNGINSDTATKTGTVGETWSGTSGNTKYDVYSDTPQGALTGVENGTYLTNARKITDSGSNSGSDTTTYNTQDKKNGSVDNVRTMDTTDSESSSGSKSGSYNENNKKDDETSNIRTLDTTDTMSQNGNKNSSFDNIESSDGSQSKTTTYDTKDTSNGGRSEEGNFSTTKEYTEHVVGKFPGTSYARKIMEYREALINVDVMVIDALSDLFMKVW